MIVLLAISYSSVVLFEMGYQVGGLSRIPVSFFPLRLRSSREDA